MIRSVIEIDEEKCDGCGQCAAACVEGAIAIIDGKARLVSESYCDGLGVCIGECPQGAITLTTREALVFDKVAAEKHAKKNTLACGCPGTQSRSLQREPQKPQCTDVVSRLCNWPVQLRLIPPSAPYLSGVDLLICADCVPLAVPDFHDRYLAGRVVMIACPKLDDVRADQEKLTRIFQEGQPKSLTVLRMEVPCCSGLTRAVVAARDGAALDVPIRVHTIGVRDGEKMEVL